MKKIFLLIFLSIFLIQFTSASVINAHGVPFVGTTNPTAINGLQIVMNETVILKWMTKDSISTATICYLFNSSYDLLLNGTFVGNNCSLNNYPVSKGNTYYVMVNKTSSAYTRPDTDAALTFPYMQPHLNITSSCYDWVGDAHSCGGSEIYDVESITTELFGGNIVTRLLKPLNDSLHFATSLNFTINASTTSYNLTNATFNIYYANGSLFNSTTNTTFNSTNGTRMFVQNFQINNYLWNVKVCGINATGTSCDSDLGNYSFNVGSNLTGELHNSTTYETEDEDFILNLTIPPSSTITNPYLNYNGTLYSATINDLGSNQYSITKTLDIPEGIGSNSFFYKWDLDGINETSINYTQSVSQSLFARCNSTLTIRYINFTFQDEGNLSVIDASIPTSTFTYWLGSGLQNKTLNFIGAENNSFAFCFSPQNRSLNIDYSLSYTKSGYQQRTTESITSLSNLTTNKTLYLLADADGLFVTFQVVNTAEQPIEGVYVTANRTINGTTTLVGSGTTGAAGSVTFWLNPDFQHTLIFSKSGYDTYTTSLIPTQSSYTIQLVTGEIVATEDYTKGVTYSILPAENTVINATVIPFNFTISTSFWTLEEYGFVIRNSSGASLGSVSDNTGTGGIVNLNINTSNYTSIVMDYYWVIEGNYTNSSRTWLIYNEEGTSWSIKQWFSDFSTYINSGMFGLDGFGKGIIIFLIILTFTGMMSWKYGLTSPAALAGIIWFLVYFFEVVLNVIPRYGALPFATILIGLMAAALAIREMRT